MPQAAVSDGRTGQRTTRDVTPVRESAVDRPSPPFDRARTSTRRMAWIGVGSALVVAGIVSLGPHASWSTRRDHGSGKDQGPIRTIREYITTGLAAGVTEDMGANARYLSESYPDHTAIASLEVPDCKLELRPSRSHPVRSLEFLWLVDEAKRSAVTELRVEESDLQSLASLVRDGVPLFPSLVALAIINAGTLTDISALGSYPRLCSIVLNGSRALKNLSPLAAMEHATFMDVSGCLVNDLSWIPSPRSNGPLDLKITSLGPGAAKPALDSARFSGELAWFKHQWSSQPEWPATVRFLTPCYELRDLPYYAWRHHGAFGQLWDMEVLRWNGSAKTEPANGPAPTGSHLSWADDVPGTPHDHRTGLPLIVRDKGTGIQMTLVSPQLSHRDYFPLSILFGGLPTTPFYLGRCEVTNAEYRRHVPSHHSASPGSERLDDEDQPVVGVSFDEARSYCKTYGFDLPRSGQWLHAYHGGRGSDAPPWGITPQDLQYVRSRIAGPGSCCGNRSGSCPPAQVGSSKSNACLVHDMDDSVSEWCWDLKWVDDAFVHVSEVYGHSWRDGPDNVGQDPREEPRRVVLFDRSPAVGFRVCRNP